MCVERQAFSGRLQEALRRSGQVPESPTRLARNFNSRFTGKPVTIHGARKWLIGQSIPTQEKLRVLADWLGVTAEWLRFGSGSEPAAPALSRNSLTRDDLAFLEELQKLDPDSREILNQMMKVLLDANRKKNEQAA